MSDLIKVVRDGPRGWHLIDPASFDPAKHQLFDGPSGESVPDENAGAEPADKAAAKRAAAAEYARAKRAADKAKG